MIPTSMSATADYVPFAQKARALIAEHAVEAQARGIVFDTDLDAELLLSVDGQGESPGTQAIRETLRFVMATIPDDCQVYFAVARPATPVSALGAGTLTLRWQVAGERRGGAEEGVTRLHPRLGDAQSLIVAAEAQKVRRAYEVAGWKLSLEAVQGGQEIWLQAGTR